MFDLPLALCLVLNAIVDAFYIGPFYVPPLLSLYAFIILLFVLLSSFYSSHSFQSKCIPIVLYLIFSGCIVDSNSDHTRAVNLDIKVFSSLDGLDCGLKFGWIGLGGWLVEKVDDTRGWG